MFDRIKSWLSREVRKLTSGTAREAGWYIWTYYRYWILGVVAVLGVLIFLGVRALTVPGENWFFACFPNTYAELGEGSDFYEGFAEYAGYDLKEKGLEFNTSIYCKPSGRVIGNAYYETLVSYLDSGALDALVMEREDIEALGEVGRLLDLEDERLNGLAARWAERLIWVEPSEELQYEKSPVAVGIDLSGSRLVGEYRAYPEGAVLGVGAGSSHLDQVEVFLNYLFEEDGE